LFSNAFNLCSFFMVRETMFQIRSEQVNIILYILLIRFLNRSRKRKILNWMYQAYSSVGIALGYGLDERGSRVRFPVGAGTFSLHHRVHHNGTGAHPASYPVGTRGSFSGGKAAGAWS
jgi:hypothetical protein